MCALHRLMLALKERIYPHALKDSGLRRARFRQKRSQWRIPLYPRSPKLTVLSHAGITRVWFLLHGGEFHASPKAAASAPLSTGVYAVRRTVGQLLEVLRRVKITVHDQAAGWAAERAI